MHKRNIMRKRRVNPSGFTLIELLLVLVILGVLAAVVVPKVANRGRDARLRAASTDIHGIATALDMFEVDNSRYPSTEEGLGILLQNTSNLPNWKGPYLTKAPIDPWQHEYIYQFPGSHHTEGFDLYSFGEDGREGNDDITNWDNG